MAFKASYKASDEMRGMLRELARLASREKFGGQVPKELTWREIEEFGHQIGKLAAAEVDQALQREHAEHFDESQSCPQCGRQCGTHVVHRELRTRDGAVDLAEPAADCPACERAFFPSASRAGARRPPFQP